MYPHLGHINHVGIFVSICLQPSLNNNYNLIKIISHNNLLYNKRYKNCLRMLLVL